MKQVLGAVLAGLIVFNGGMSQLPVEDWLKIVLGLSLSSVIAGLSYYLGMPK